MDQMTERILEKNRQRKMLLEQELKKNVNLNTGTNVSSAKTANISQTNSTRKPRISYGIDSSPMPPVSKLLNRWEKASQIGANVNLDDSVVEHNATASNAPRQPTPVFQPQIAKWRNVTSQMPVPLRPTIVNVDETKEITAGQVSSPGSCSYSPSDPSGTASDERSLDQSHNATGMGSLNSSTLSDCLNEAILFAQNAIQSTPASPGGFSSAACASSINPVAALVHEADFSSFAPVTYTLSVYRKFEKHNPQNDRSPSAIIVKPPMSPDRQQTLDDGRNRNMETRKPTDSILSVSKYNQRQKELNELISVMQTQVSQASQALHLCRSSVDFRGSRQEMDAQKALLIAAERRRCLIDELKFLDCCYRTRLPYDPVAPLGTVTISRITVPLHYEFYDCYMNYRENFAILDNSVGYVPFEKCFSNQADEDFNFLCLLKYRDIFHVTQMIDNEEILRMGELTFSNYFQFRNLPHNFEIILDVYALRTRREKGDKKHSSAGKGTSVGRQRSRLGLFNNAAITSSPGGPMTILESSFELLGRLKITLASVNQRKFALHGTKYGSPLEGGICLEVRSVPEMVGMETECGYLDRYEKVGGAAAWNRLWCVLNGDLMKFWNYTEDELEEKAPVFTVDMKDCISGTIGPAPTTITARANTFWFECVNDTVYIFSTTKEQWSVWCNKLNSILHNLRLWTPARH